jgi:hypothetical protein
MADQLASPEDLASLLERDDMDLYKATMLVECATAVVQEAAGGQRIVQVVDDTAELLGTTASRLQLPQWPVTAVTSVLLDGVAVSEGTASGTWRRPGTSWLWRDTGWATTAGEPSTVIVVYSHGLADDHQDRQFARNAVLGLLRGVFGNAEGATRVEIDDYAAAYDALTARMEASPHLQRALARKYGRSAGLVKIGGG